MECPHCYLQYNGPNESLSEEYANKVLEADFLHLAIVGKEPTLSPKIVEYLVRENSERKRKTSIITNGTNLLKLSEETLTSLDYIDVSFDGGPETYSKRRKGNFKDIIENIKRVKEYETKFNVLHTLYSENLQDLDDMMRLEELPYFNIIAFSPYKVPHNQGSVSVRKSSLVDQILPYLAKNNKFIRSDKTKLLISGSDITAGDPKKFAEEVERLNLSDKVCYVENPIQNGFVRVTYDGRVLSPDDATHTLLYKIKGYSINDPKFKNLNEIFSQLIKEK